MRGCEVCGSHDNPRRTNGVKLCWECRRIPGLSEVPGMVQRLYTPRGVRVSRPLPRILALVTMRKVREHDEIRES